MARECGALLYQQAQLLMKRMQDDPYLSIRPAIPTTVQSVSMESSGPDPTSLDNTNGLGNLESMTPPIDSSDGGTTQPETGRLLIETQAPNPLSTLIHTYSDDKNPECPSGTLVHIQEEVGPKKTPSPSPKKTSYPGPEGRAHTFELIGVGRALSEAAQDRAKRDEKERVAAQKELEHLHSFVNYYKGDTQNVVYLKDEFGKVYDEFKKERHLLISNIAEFQEDTLMAFATCKEMERWYEKA